MRETKEFPMSHVPLYVLPRRRHVARRVKVRRCGKIRYPSKVDAVRALSSTSQARALDDFLGVRSDRREVRVYRCPTCHGFHLTSRPMWRERERRPYPATVPEPIPASVVKTVVPSGHILRSIHEACARATWSESVAPASQRHVTPEAEAFGRAA